MKKTTLIFLAFLMLIPSYGARKNTKTPIPTFPDGTVISDWFKEGDDAKLENLGKQYSLADFGIASEPDLVQTARIQAVIDKCAEDGGGVVVVPEGIYKSGALFLKKGTNMYLCRGAVLLGSEDISDFPVMMTRIEGQICPYFPALVNILDLDGITLAGEGIIDGNGSPYWRAFRIRRQWNPACTNKDEQRPRLVHVANSKNIEINGLSLQNSPFWTCHIYKSEFVKLIGLRVFSPVAPIRSASADGIDLDVCSNVYVKGCRITVNDDSICFKGGKGPYADQDPANGINENILIEECFFDRSTGSTVTCGSESVHTRNVLVRNCTIDHGRTLLLLKMRPDTPQNYEYITLDGIKGSGAGVFSVSRWTQFFDLQGREDKPMSYGSNIIIKNIELEATSFISGRAVDEEYLVDGVTFENVNVNAQNPDWDRALIKNAVFKNVTLNGSKVE